ncbi:MAG: hypothetical protein JJT85_09500 [Chromatiales bacterium]|nr:hypothetical protein [Chromatiales bacterium]
MAKKMKEIPSKYAEDWVETLDRRSAVSRAVLSRLAALEDELGGDLSYQRRSLARRAVWVEAICELREAELARGGLEQMDLGPYVQAINALTGLYRVLGFDRAQKKVPDLQSYIASKANG